MTDDELIALGAQCELLLNSEWFKLVTQQFDMQCFAHFMQTSPEEKMKREGTYQQWQGARDFLAHLAAYVDQARQTKERNAPSTDALEGFD